MTTPLIIVSVAVMRSRIEFLPLVLESIIKNTVYPNYMIHIFYSEEGKYLDAGCTDLSAFHDMASRRRFPVIRITEVPNIGPLRKILPALRLYTDSFILTIDDDEVFECDILSLYMAAYNQHHCIVCSAAKIIDLSDGSVMTDTLEYYETIFSTGDDSFMHLIPEGYGGILYHTSMFSSAFIDIDFELAEQIVVLNDDILLRMHTIPVLVHVRPIYQSCIYDKHRISTLFQLNRQIGLADIMKQVRMILPDIQSAERNIHDELQTLWRYTKPQETYKRVVHNGTDVKKLQYRKIRHGDASSIPFEDIMNQLFFPDAQDSIHIALINLEKDEMRYHSTICEFKKILITDFVHIKATYWMNRKQFIQDLNDILRFLRRFSDDMPCEEITMNLFSEFNDRCISIQDGPLACYCSHLRAMMYGYHYFSDYTIIAEDDIDIQDTSMIRSGLQEVPNDWDIICFGSQPINKYYHDGVYKMSSLFHSTHFYIVRNASMEKIFGHLYPIDDQIDILLARLHPQLNIYNITDSVIQKNFSTNTQNNLHVIFHSPNYEFIRKSLCTIKTLLRQLFMDIYTITPYDGIIQKIVFDVILRYIRCDDASSTDSVYKDMDYNAYFLDHTRIKLYKQMYIVMDSCLKGINTEVITHRLMNDIDDICGGFHLCSETRIPFDFGSTCNVYRIGPSMVLKSYHARIRWRMEGHEDQSEIYKKECRFYDITQHNGMFPQLIRNDPDGLYIEYVGESLFDKFLLPNDWKTQLDRIFTELDRYNIFYPEFNLKNITVRDSQLFFIDYGLVRFDSDRDNKHNNECFRGLLEMIHDKFVSITDQDERHVFYYNLIHNLRHDEIFSANIF